MVKKLTCMNSNELAAINGKIKQIGRQISGEKDLYFKMEYIKLLENVENFKEANKNRKNPFLKKFISDATGIQKDITQEKNMHKWLFEAEKKLLRIERKLNGQANGQVKRDVERVRSFSEKDYVQKMIWIKPFKSQILKKIRDYKKILPKKYGVQMQMEFE